MSLAERSAADLLAELGEMRLSQKARAQVEALLDAVRREERAATEVRCAPDGWRETADRAVAYAARAGYLAAVRDVGDEVGQQFYGARDAALAEEQRASEALWDAPIAGASYDARIDALKAVETYQAELRDAAPDHDRTDVQPLAALRALHGKGQGE